MGEVYEQFGPYKRIRRLGVGGMAETFLAVHRAAAGFEQRVCMKFILPGYRQNADFRRLFLREASIAASLRHSNIVGIIDVDAAAGYMVLELVDGVDLRTLLTATPTRRLTPELATLVTIELCKALSYAHGRVRRGQADGIVHRDVSPSNVLVSYAGEVKLTDFGVARTMRSDAEPLSTTVKGKLCYMSPEQARGMQLDGRSDLFAVGVLYYELLSGTRPFDGNTDAETLLRVTTGQHAPLLEIAPDVPPALAQVVEKLIAHDREQRYASADACIDALSRFAPRVTSFRELGQLARAAKPHETLIADVDDLEHAHSGPRHPLGLVTATQAVPESSGSLHLPEPKSRGSRSGESEFRDYTRSETDAANARVHRSAWIALGVSLSALLLVCVVWLTQLRDQSIVKATDVKQPPKIEPVVPSGPDTIPSEIPINVDDPNPLEASDPAPPATTPQPTPTKPPVFATVDTKRAGNREAVLTVGVIPTGQVWIDNRPYGYSPVRNVRLRPGRYVVGGGETRQQVQRTITLKPGQTRQLVLSLDSSGSVHDDATD